MKFQPVICWVIVVLPLLFAVGEETGSAADISLKGLKRKHGTSREVPHRNRFVHNDDMMAAMTNARMTRRKYVKPGVNKLVKNHREGITTPKVNNQRTGLTRLVDNNNRKTKAGDIGYSMMSSNRDTVIAGSATDALKTYYNTFDGQNVNFGYRIDDEATSNRQARYESGNPEDEITGSYSVQEPDGTMRIVYYVADWLNGFRATITDKDGMRRYGVLSNNNRH